jgi:hypothetical protein
MVLKAVIMKNLIFWDKTLCGSLKVNRRYGGTHFASKRTTWRYIPEDRTLHVISCFEIQRGREGRESEDWCLVWAHTLCLLSTWRRDHSATFEIMVHTVALIRAGCTSCPFRWSYWPRPGTNLLSPSASPLFFETGSCIHTRNHPGDGGIVYFRNIHIIVQIHEVEQHNGININISIFG